MTESNEKGAEYIFRKLMRNGYHASGNKENIKQRCQRQK